MTGIAQHDEVDRFNLVDELPTIPDVASRGQAIALTFGAGSWNPLAMAQRVAQLMHHEYGGGWVKDLATAATEVWDHPPAFEVLTLFVDDWMVARLGGWPRALDGEQWPASFRSGYMRTCRFGVPIVHDITGLAELLGVSIGEVRSFSRQWQDRPVVDRAHHYRYRWVPASYERARLIEIPKPRLRDVQRQINRLILSKVPTHEAAHGFVSGRSVHSFIRAHIATECLIKLDLEAFFTSIPSARIIGIFKWLGYPNPVAVALGGICTTKAPFRAREMCPPFPDVSDRRRTLRRLGDPHLPQGAPTSPALANLVAFHLDTRLAGLADQFGARYTRYGDDLAFSSGDIGRSSPRFMKLAASIVNDEGFSINARKTAVRRQGDRQRLCGVVVNAHPAVTRTDFDRLKAILHDAQLNGLDAANREGRAEFRRHLEGRIAWISSLQPERGRRLADMLSQAEE
jgi:RNA-directed DNA polymerase